MNKNDSEGRASPFTRFAGGLILSLHGSLTGSSFFPQDMFSDGESSPVCDRHFCSSTRQRGQVVGRAFGQEAAGRYCESTPRNSPGPQWEPVNCHSQGTPWAVSHIQNQTLPSCF